MGKYNGLDTLLKRAFYENLEGFGIRGGSYSSVLLTSDIKRNVKWCSM